MSVSLACCYSATITLETNSLAHLLWYQSVLFNSKELHNSKHWPQPMLKFRPPNPESSFLTISPQLISLHTSQVAHQADTYVWFQ